MTGEFWAIVAVGLTLAGLIVAQGRGLSARMGRLEVRLNGRLDKLEGRLAAVEHSQAKLGGLLEGLREAIAGNRAA